MSLPRNKLRPAPFARRRRGILLMELMAYVGMLAVAGLVATQILRTTLRVWRETDSHQLRTARFDNAVGRLRNDAWGATSFELKNDHHVHVAMADGSSVEWEASADGITRTLADTNPPDRWPGLGASTTFAIRGPLLVLRVDPGPQDFPQEIILPSQTMLLEGRRP